MVGFFSGLLPSLPPLQCIALFDVLNKVMYADFYNILYTVLSASGILYYSIDGTETSKLLVYWLLISLCTFPIQRRVLIAGYSSLHVQYSSDYSVLYTIHDAGREVFLG